jgi:hypothetical protein
MDHRDTEDTEKRARIIGTLIITYRTLMRRSEID